MSFGAANSDARLGNDPAVELVHRQRHCQRIIAGAPAELIETEPRIGGEQR